jgi:hypothetical protein
LFTIQFAIVDGPEEGTRYDFQQNEVKVGSEFSNDLILIHPEVAPRHFRVVDEKDEIYVENLTGKNETKLNGVFVSREPLHNGDELQIGPYVFHISLERGVLPDEAIYESQVSAIIRPRARAFIKRPPVLVLVSLALIVLIYLAFTLVTKKEEGQDLSQLGPVPLPAEGIFGHKVEGRNYLDKVEFSFVATYPKYRVQYRPGFIEDADKIKIFVNENRVGTVPLTIGRWADEPVSVDIPQNDLKMGETNLLRFDNTAYPPVEIRWGVRDVSLVEVPIPKCDIEVAKKYLRLGQDKYEERRIAESNLSDAIKYLKQGQEYVIACEDSEVRNTLEDTLDQYKKELQDKFEEYMFNTKKFLKLGDFYGAQYELEQVLRYIPDESDRRHRQAKDLLEKTSKLAK